MPHFHENETLILIAGWVEGFWDFPSLFRLLGTPSTNQSTGKQHRWILPENSTSGDSICCFIINLTFRIRFSSPFLHAQLSVCQCKNLSSLAKFLAANLFQIFHSADLLALITRKIKNSASFLSGNEAAKESAKTFGTSLGTKTMQITTQINYE